MDLLIGFQIYSQWISVDSYSQSKLNMNKITSFGEIRGITSKIQAFMKNPSPLLVKRTIPVLERFQPWQN